MKHCLEKAKQEILIRYICGDTPKELSEKFGIHVATVYRWINTWENEAGKHFLTELPLQEMGTAQYGNELCRDTLCKIALPYV